MKSYKSTLIKRYGTTVEIHKYLGDKPKEIVETKALLGRSTRTNSNLRTFEHQKAAQFLPKTDVSNGDFVVNKIHDESYVVVGVHQEYDGNKTLAMVTNVLKCGHKLDLKGNVEVADSRGNLKVTFDYKYQNVPCYLEQITAQLRQYEPGLNTDTEHLVYTTDLKIELTDRLIIGNSSFKVVDRDYTTFPGLVRVEVSEDKRV